MTPLNFHVSLRRVAECTCHALLCSSLSTTFSTFSQPVVTGFTACTPSLCSSNAESTAIAKTGTWQSATSPAIAAETRCASTSRSDERLLRQVFEMLDADGDGYVSADDVARHLAKLGLGAEDIETLEEMVQSAARGGEPLGYEDFVNLYEGECEGGEEEEEQVAEAFAVFDEDGDGFISVRELQQVLVSLGFTQCHDEAFCHLIIKSVAPHSDGKIDLPHFRRMLLS